MGYSRVAEEPWQAICVGCPVLSRGGGLTLPGKDSIVERSPTLDPDVSNTDEILTSLRDADKVIGP